MPLQGSEEEREPSPPISNRLHTIPLPFLKWGTQRHLRCSITAANDDAAGPSASGDLRQSNSDESTATRNRASGSNEKQEEKRENVKSWNLRLRRRKGRAVENDRDCSTPARVPGGGKLTRPRRNEVEKTERVKFSVALSKSMVEEDFMAMLGHKPPRRPNKRPKVVQKQLDNIFPGLYLTEVTADMYKVVDCEHQSTKRKGKRKRKVASM